MLIGTATLAPVLYIPHGGGPLPLLGDPAHRQLVGRETVSDLCDEYQRQLNIFYCWQKQFLEKGAAALTELSVFASVAQMQLPVPWASRQSFLPRNVQF
jgi:hypothetical protein